MSQIVVWCVAGIIPLLATVSLLRYGVPAWAPPAKDVLQSGLKPAAAPPLKPSSARRAAEEKGAEADKPKFDVVRINPDGASVFAGRAAAESTVTVLANGMPIASPRADENGEWAVVLEHNFAAGDYQLSLGSTPGKPADGQTVRITIAPTETGSDMQATSVSPVIPKPITFVYDEASFTLDGRRAAAALSEYLRLQRLETVTLSGHADERGSQPYNMELSRQRLHTVERYLRDHGFAGRFVLTPKGKMEPFGVAGRRSLAKDDAYQLDRRVELHLAE